jgi:hypothetical protein
MTRKFKVWFDSGANIHSCRTVEVTMEEVGFTSEEWDTLKESEQETVMRDIAFSHSDWGYSEIEKS